MKIVITLAGPIDEDSELGMLVEAIRFNVTGHIEEEGLDVQLEDIEVVL